MVSSSSSAVSLIRSSSPCNPLLQLPRNLLPLLLRRATHFPAVAQPASPPPHNPLPQLSIRIEGSNWYPEEEKEEDRG
ncbi:hypothetical protein HN51_002193, partial [Arachis hypogaea]